MCTAAPSLWASIFTFQLPPFGWAFPAGMKQLRKVLCPILSNLRSCNSVQNRTNMGTQILWCRIQDRVQVWYVSKYEEYGSRAILSSCHIPALSWRHNCHSVSRVTRSCIPPGIVVTWGSLPKRIHLYYGWTTKSRNDDDENVKRYVLHPSVCSALLIMTKKSCDLL